MIGRRLLAFMACLGCKFRRDAKATTAVEFGLVGVPFVGLLVAIFEASLVMLNSEGLEAAVQDAARNILTGEAQAANVSSAASFVSTYMCPSTGPRVLPSFIDCSKLIVDVRVAASFSSADLSRTFYKSASNQFCLGGPAKIVVVRVAYPMPVFLPLIGQLANGTVGQIQSGLVNDVPNSTGYKHLLVGTAVFQTEPFAASSYTAPSGC